MVLEGREENDSVIQILHPNVNGVRSCILRGCSRINLYDMNLYDPR